MWCGLINVRGISEIVGSVAKDLAKWEVFSLIQRARARLACHFWTRRLPNEPYSTPRGAYRHLNTGTSASCVASQHLGACYWTHQQ